MALRYRRPDEEPGRAGPFLGNRTTLTGKHLIAGEWVDGTDRFRSAPASGAARDYAEGTAAHVDVRRRRGGGRVLDLRRALSRAALSDDLRWRGGLESHGA